MNIRCESAEHLVQSSCTIGANLQNICFSGLSHLLFPPLSSYIFPPLIFLFLPSHRFNPLIPSHYPISSYPLYSYIQIFAYSNFFVSVFIYIQISAHSHTHVSAFFTIQVSKYFTIPKYLHIPKYPNTTLYNSLFFLYNPRLYSDISTYPSIKVCRYLKIFRYFLAVVDEKLYLCN